MRKSSKKRRSSASDIKAGVKAVKTTTELIQLREEDRISVDEFAEKVSLNADLFSKRWLIVFALLVKNRSIRNKELLSACKDLEITGKKTEKLNDIRGILKKFEELGLICSFKVQTFSIYLSNLRSFYTPEEAFDAIPNGSVDAVINRLRQSSKSIQLKVLAKNFEKLIGANLLETLLEFYVEKGVIYKHSNGYRLTRLGVEYGFDETAIQTLDTMALENAAALKRRVEAAKFRFGTLSEISDAQRRDLEKKEVSTIVLPGRKLLRISALGEVLYGNQFSANALIERWLQLATESKDKPHIILATGLVQGNFLGYRVDKNRILTQEDYLSEIGPQFSAADLLLTKLEELAETRVFYQQGDDDWDLAKNYALIARAAEGGAANYGVANLSPEATRFLINRDFYRKLEIQWELIQKYMYLTGHSLRNAAEVAELIGVEKSEYRLIIEILAAREANQPIPDIYKKVVDFSALDGNIVGKRYVTPDPLVMKFGPFVIQAVHNLAFSDVTQYADSMLIPEMNIRARQALGEETPNIFLDFHQERFYLARIGDTLVMNLPGLQDTRLATQWRMKSYNTKVLSSKSHRQVTFRKEPSVPGITSLEISDDGRIRINILNQKILGVIDASKDEPEVVDRVCYVSDTQFGSITARPEFLVKYMDYCLYGNRSNILISNGDIIQGVNYPQFFAENRPDRLVSIDSQERFMLKVMAPLIVDAPVLRNFKSQLGNHEWNTFGAGITGQNNLKVLEMYVRGYFEGLQKAGKLDRAIDVSMMSRIRFLKSGNPLGDPMNHPYTAIPLPSGYKVGVQHMWQSNGGRTPAEQMIRWVRKMAHGASDLHLMFGGHWHSLWMAMVWNILMVQVPACAGISGFELQRGLMSQVMFIYTEFSNKKGITIEIVPWQFLDEYKCQSPFYMGKDEDLRLPERGTAEYNHGRHSKLIESMIDDITFYTEV